MIGIKTFGIALGVLLCPHWPGTHHRSTIRTSWRRSARRRGSTPRPSRTRSGRSRAASTPPGPCWTGWPWWRESPRSCHRHCKNRDLEVSNSNYIFWRKRITCCKARCPAARCDLRARATCPRPRTPPGSSASCSRTRTAPPTSSSSWSGSAGSKRKEFGDWNFKI